MTPWAIQSMEFSRTEYQSGWPFPSPGDLPNPEQADSLPAETEGMYLSHERCIQILVKWRIPEWVAFAFSGGSSLTRGSNPGLLHCKRILHQLTHQGSPRMLGWVAYPFSSRSSQPRNRTSVSCMAGRFFTN